MNIKKKTTAKIALAIIAIAGIAALLEAKKPYMFDGTDRAGA